MRIVIGLCLLTFLVLVTANQDEGDNSLRRVQREPSAEGGQQNQGPQRRRANKLKRKKKSKKSRKLKNRKTKNRKNKNRRNKKTRRVGKFRGLEQGRQAPLQGTGCQYVNLLDIISRGNACENGKKFVMKGRNARRQFLIVENKVLLAFVTLNTKFTACTSFEDVTSSVNCKVVDGLSSVNLGATSQSTTAAAASTAAATSTGSQFRCGVKKAGTRIVGGQEVQVQEYPWLVAIGRPSGAWYGCGGTLVGKEWVVSAAHCFVGVSASELTAILGDHNLDVANDGNRLVVPVAQLINHPNYVQATFENDLTLLRLSQSVDLNAYTPACLPASLQSFTGKTAFAYGWGTTESGGQVSPVALDVDVPVVSRATCISAMGNGIVDGMLCAGGEANKDACQGDSGGPLSTPDESTKQHFLIGATSFGDGCGQAGKYGVYTDIAFYRTFMDQQFAANGGISLTP